MVLIGLRTQNPYRQKGHTEGQSEGHTEEQTLGRTDSRTDIYSSSISIYNNKLLLTKVAEIFATHPDFAFWIEEKLKPDTVLRWIENSATFR